MLSRFSVKKPLTVAVSVILALILGVLSFRNMTTDLLPSMEMPYVMVFTSYPGATPEKVEASVTRPLEQVLSITNGVQRVTSVSQSHSSMMMLEFVEGSNMDTAMIELNSKIDLLKGSLPDEVAAPILMTMDPEMLPIVVSSVDVDGMELEKVSAYTRDTLIPTFRRIPGVASVSASGLVEKELHIRMEQDKIDALNDTILSGVDKTLAEAQQKLDATRKELAAGRETMLKEQQKAIAEMAKGQAQLNEKKDQLTSGMLMSGQALQELQATKGKLTQQKELLDTVADALSKIAVPLEENKARQQAVADSLAALRQTPNADKAEISRLSAQEEDLKNEEARLLAAQGPIGSLLEQMGIQSRDAFLDLRKQVTDGLSTCDKAIKDLTDKQGNMKEAQKALVDVQTKMEEGKMTLTLSSVQAAMGLSQGEAQLTKAQQELDTAKDTAMKKAGLDGMLTPSMLGSILMAQNFSMPAGTLQGDGMDYTVKVGDVFSSVEELEALTVIPMEAGDLQVISLKDVATVEPADNTDRIYARINGNPGVLLAFQKQSNTSTAELSHEIQKTALSLQEGNPSLHITTLSDQGLYIDRIIQSVMENLIFGGILAIIILFLFLRSIRPTVTVAFSIPLSLVLSVVLMYFSGVTLNIISLSGLALGVGMLVDNSIVVIENIYRLRQEGMDRFKASVYGAVQVSGAIFASTLTTVCVFLPIIFTQGMSRELFSDMGLTIAYSLLSSLVVALTLVPAMSSRLLNKPVKPAGKGFTAVVKGYERALRFTLKHKIWVCLAALLLLVGSVTGVFWMGTAFIPSAESVQMTANVEMPKDTTTPERREMVDGIVETIQSMEDVETVGVMEGGAQKAMMSTMGGSSEADSSAYMLYLVLKEDKSKSNAQIAQDILDKTAALPCEITVAESTMDMSAMGGSGIQVRLQGDDLDDLQKAAADVAGVLRGIEGTENVDDGSETAHRELRVDVDKNKAMAHGLTVAQVYQQLSERLKTQVKSTELTLDGEKYPVILSAPYEALTPDTLKDMELSGKKGQEAEKVKLSDIASIGEGTSPAAIRHAQRVRTHPVYAEIAEGYNIGLVSRQVEEKLKNFDLPDGVTLEFGGENEQIKDSLADLGLMVLVAVAFIYLIMVAQFQSLLSPFIVMVTIPLAFTGGLLALQLTGFELSVISMLGFLVLAGIVVNNGIVFVDHVNQLRRQGVSRGEALVQTGVTRLRPILMTALTTILGLSTMALGLGMGADMIQPLAIVVIGGLSYATLLTLFVVPCLYDWMQKKEPKTVKIPRLELPED